MRLGNDAESAPVAGAADETQWYDIVGRLRSSVDKFRVNFSALLAQRAFVSQHPTLQTEYNTLANRGNAINQKINEVQGIIDKVSGWFTSIKTTIFGGAAPAPAPTTPTTPIGPLDGLGVIQVLPIAVIAGAVALITKWLADVYVFAKKVEEIKRLESKGLSPQRAADMLERAMPTGLMDVLKGNIIWLVIGGVLLLFGPEIMRIIQGRK